MLQWFSELRAALDAFAGLTPVDGVAIDYLRERSETTGYCPACRRPVTFTVSPDPIGGTWRNFLEGMICQCGTNGRTRMITIAWREIRDSFAPVRSLIFERVTPTFERMASEDPSLIGCEYLGPDKVPGQEYELGSVPVRHEDLLNLSFDSSSIDLLMHFDVLEHVPDHRRSLEECFRVLRPGGQMLFTLPFFHNREKHLVRARVGPDAIEHILPPAYHGNPVGDGALVFMHPGRELLSDLAAAGFETRLGLAHNLGFGMVSNGCPWPEEHMWPVIFLASKPQIADIPH